MFLKRFGSYVIFLCLNIDQAKMDFLLAMSLIIFQFISLSLPLFFNQSISIEFLFLPYFVNFVMYSKFFSDGARFVLVSQEVLTPGVPIHIH